MFRKLLNVGKGHSSIDKLQQQTTATQNQQNQNLQQLRSQFEFCEIKSYGFSHLTCLGYSSSLSLLAVGSKHGLIRVLGGPSVEFNHQLEWPASIRKLEFIDCRLPEQNTKPPNNNKKGKNNKQNNNQQHQDHASSKNGIQDKNEQDPNVPAKLVALTDNGQLHLLELKNVKQLCSSDNQTQTETTSTTTDPSKQQQAIKLDESQSILLSSSEYSSLVYVGVNNFFKCNVDDDDRSRRVSSIEISSDGNIIFVGSEGGNIYLIPVASFYNNSKHDKNRVQDDEKETTDKTPTSDDATQQSRKEIDTEDICLSVEQQVTNIDHINAAEVDHDEQDQQDKEIYDTVKFDDLISPNLSDDIKHKKPGAVESIKKHPNSSSKILVSYHRGLSIIFDVAANKLDKYFYHNQVLESSCFADQSSGDFFYTSHNDGSYIKWDIRQGSQSKANQDSLNQLYGPYPCKPTPKITSCTGLKNDHLEDLIIFSDGLPRATYDDKNPVSIVRADAEGKEAVKIVLDFSSKVLDFVVITRPRGNLGHSGGKASQGQSTGGGGGGKKNKNKQHNHHQQQQQQQQNRNVHIAVALAVLAEEEFVVIDLLNSESQSFLEFSLPYLNCIHSSAITCSQLYSNIGDKLYERLQSFCRKQVKGKLSTNDWPISGGKLIEQIESKSHDVLLTGHEDGSINIWDVSNLSMHHLQHISTSRFYSTNEDDTSDQQQQQQETTTTSTTQTSNKAQSTTTSNNQDNSNTNNNDDSSKAENGGAWPPFKRVGRFDPYSDDARLAVRRLTMCPQTGTMVAAGTGGQVVVLELKDEPTDLASVEPTEVTLITDVKRFVWKGHDRLAPRTNKQLQAPGYQLNSCVQLVPPVAATSLELRFDWQLFALGTQYGFLLYDLNKQEALIAKCLLNPADYANIAGDAPGTMSRKKSFRKSLRESFRRLRLGRSMRSAHPDQSTTTTGTAPSSQQSLSRSGGRQLAFSRPTTGVRTLNAPSAGSGAPSPSEHHPIIARNAIFSNERQVEAKEELSSIVRCLSLVWAHIGPAQAPLKPSLWVGTNSGQVLIYAITLPTDIQQHQSELNSSTSSASRPTTTEQATTDNVTSSSDSTTTPATASGKQTTIEAKLAREIQLKHRAPIVAIFVTPNEPEGLNEPNNDLNMSANQLEKSSSFESSATGTSNLSSSGVVGDRKSPEPNERGEQGGTHSPQPGTTSTLNRQQQARVLICTEEQFKVFNLPNLKPFCKFKLTANEGLRAKKVIISRFKKPIVAKSLKLDTKLLTSKSLQSFATQTSRPTTPADDKLQQQSTENNNSPNQLNNNHSTNELMEAKFGAKNNAIHQQMITGSQTQTNLQSISEAFSSIVYEPFLVCMSNQGDCAIYGTNDLKRQAQVQVCKREDVNGIQSTMLTQFGEGYYLKSTSNFLRFSLTNQRVPRVLALV